MPDFRLKYCTIYGTRSNPVTKAALCCKEEHFVCTRRVPDLWKATANTTDIRTLAKITKFWSILEWRTFRVEHFAILQTLFIYSTHKQNTTCPKNTLQSCRQCSFIAHTSRTLLVQRTLCNPADVVHLLHTQAEHYLSKEHFAILQTMFIYCTHTSRTLLVQRTLCNPADNVHLLHTQAEHYFSKEHFAILQTMFIYCTHKQNTTCPTRLD
jgi:hypothetical protein